MDKNRTKTLNRKKPFYYHDIINYINNHNKHINKTKIKTKTIYQKITQEGSKQHTITGEIKKNKYQIFSLNKYGKTLFNHRDNLL